MSSTVVRMNTWLTAGGAVASLSQQLCLHDWDGVKKGKGKDEKQSEMILPSVLSEASSLVAKRGKKGWRKKKYIYTKKESEPKKGR